MTKVTLLFAADGCLRGYECKGHAGWGEEGGDIVCAAISALSITCCNALEKIAGVTPLTVEKEGFLSVSLPGGESNHDADVILRVFEQGARDIAASYPKHIHITNR